ncbi:hypothetical protein [Acetonema longum]|uniref:FlgN family protein n=1 Tax=Acetonema longum DSM 6540 TaxID=1009370 RepID=F7NH04_9FIRM|nr:hypothetical protein [Acetonema longum]EGO64735.1 hypothetical protein ALO_06728 [Acetonema longum DSM 6540]
MADQCEFQAALLKKLELLEKILINTATQSRFVRRREMTGLRRLLRERAALLNELAALNHDLRGNNDREMPDEFKPVIRVIEVKQGEILALSDQAMQDAVNEHKRIMAELNNVRMMRRLKNGYDQPAGGIARVSRLNLKG